MTPGYMVLLVSTRKIPVTDATGIIIVVAVVIIVVVVVVVMVVVVMVVTPPSDGVSA